MTVSPYLKLVPRSEAEVRAQIQGRILSPLVSTKGQVRWEDYNFIRVSTPAPWETRHAPMPRSWLQIAVGVMAFGMFGAGALYIAAQIWGT